MFYLHGTTCVCLLQGCSYLVLQDQSSRRSSDGAAQHRSTVDAAELQQAPALKPLKINKNNFAGLEAQGERAILLAWHDFPVHAATLVNDDPCLCVSVSISVCTILYLTCWSNVNMSLQSMRQISTSVGAFLDGSKYLAAAFASAATQCVTGRIAAADAHAFQLCMLRNDSSAECAQTRQAEWGCARGSHPSHENGGRLGLRRVWSL